MRGGFRKPTDHLISKFLLRTVAHQATAAREDSTSSKMQPVYVLGVRERTPPKPPSRKTYNLHCFCSDLQGCLWRKGSAMFNRLKLSDRRYQSTSLQRLDVAAPDVAQKTPPVDPHSLDVLRDGVPRYARPPGSPHYFCPSCFWVRGDPLR